MPDPLTTRQWLERLVPGATAVGQAADWLGAQVRPSPERQARFDELARPMEERGRAFAAERAQPPPEPVRRAGAAARKYLGEQFTPSPEAKATGEALRAGLTKQTTTGQPLYDALLAPQRVAGNFAIDSLIDATTPGGQLLNVDLPFGKAAGAAGTFAGALPPGFFSRVDRVAEQVGKKGIHPNKLASLLKSGASQEEVAYRNLPALITGAGDKPITREALQAHLVAHPPPQLETTVLGETAERRAAQERLNELARLGPDRTYEQDDQYESLARRLLHGQEFGGAPKYSGYTLPGGESYQESLLRQRPTDPTALEQYEFFPKTGNQLYRSGHFDQPNILTHVRHKERTLPVTGLRSIEEIEPLIQRAIGALDPGHIASGAPGVAVRAGVISPEEAQLYGAAKGFRGFTAPTGERGRFIEEVQSDWHQAGKKQGYQQPSSPADEQRLAQLRDEIEQGQRAVADVNHELKEVANVRNAQMIPQLTRPFLAPEYAHLTSFSDATGGGRTAVEAWRAAREQAWSTPEYQAARGAEQAVERRLQEAVNRVSALQEEQTALHTKTQKGVPDAPFKETWPDLALKQQLLDVANRRDLSFLGFTSGKTQAARYDLSKQVSKIEYDPIEKQLYAYDHDGERVINQFTEPGDLADYIGKEPADKLAEQINRHEAGRKWERSQWSVEEDVDKPGRFFIYDSNGELLYQHGGTPERYSSAQEAEARIDDLLNDTESPMASRDLPTLEGLDLQVGGEGMKNFYDQLLPKRLQKILAPFGGTVERGEIPAGTKMQPGLVTRYRIVDPRGQWQLPSYRDFTSEAEAKRAASFLEGESDPFLTVEPYQAPGEVSVPHAEPAWIARLTPEQKARIRKEGFPLMALPLITGAALAGQPESQVGQPPPVR